MSGNLEDYDMEAIGEEIGNFFKSPVGQYLSEIMAQERELLRDRLERIDIRTPWGKRKWRRVREELDVYGKINEYLVSMLQDARAHAASVDYEKTSTDEA